MLVNKQAEILKMLFSNILVFYLAATDTYESGLWWSVSHSFVASDIVNGVF